MTKAQRQIQNNPWGRLLVFIFAIFLPTVAIGISTALVMPDALLMIGFSLFIDRKSVV